MRNSESLSITLEKLLELESTERLKWSMERRLTGPFATADKTIAVRGGWSDRVSDWTGHRLRGQIHAE